MPEAPGLGRGAPAFAVGFRCPRLPDPCPILSRLIPDACPTLRGGVRSADRAPQGIPLRNVIRRHLSFADAGSGRRDPTRRIPSEGPRFRVQAL